MADFIRRIAEHGYQKRRLALIENGSWAPTAAKVMSKMLEGCRELELVSQPVTIRSAMSEENERQIKELAALL
jgi:flavorubredoxin